MRLGHIILWIYLHTDGNVVFLPVSEGHCLFSLFFAEPFVMHRTHNVTVDFIFAKSDERGSVR